MSEPLMIFNGVGFSYQPQNADHGTGENMVLHSLSFTVENGSTTAVLGPNGAGKTTLLHLALGWLTPGEGSITLRGKPVRSYGQRERGRIMSLVPQREHIPFEYSLLEYVLLGRAPHLRPLEMPGEEDYAIAMESLDRVGLYSARDRSINRLSSGERQLLLLARSLAQQPRLLLLDEPTSHLDVANKKRIVELLKGMRNRGLTLVLTTHDPQVASSVADQLLLMRNGGVLRTGALDELLTADALTATYGVDVRVVEVEGRRIAVWV
jgi:iron complex transport system ATP-binding protein